MPSAATAARCTGAFAATAGTSDVTVLGGLDRRRCGLAVFVISATFFSSLVNAHGQRFHTTWTALLGRLCVPRVVADKHHAPGLSFATYRGDRRSLANVETVHAVGLDLDKRLDWDVLAGLCDPFESFVHTTWTSTDEAPRARAFLLLSRPVTGDEYRRVYAACAEQCTIAGLEIDRAASDPSRFWFLPSIPPGGKFRYTIGRGKTIDVDGALARVPSTPAAPAVPDRPSAPPAPDTEARAAAYLARCEPAVSGNGGHRVTFDVAQRLVRGFSLDEETAYRLLADWNQRCDPPWSERELRRKVQQAARHGRMAEGALADRRRAS